MVVAFLTSNATKDWDGCDSVGSDDSLGDKNDEPRPVLVAVLVSIVRSSEFDVP